MTVNITWSLTAGGVAITDDVDHGNGSNGQTLTAQTIFMRHDGSNPITGCALYIREYSGTYIGGASAALDFAEILGWGDASTASAFGGFQVNMNATGSFPAAAWPAYSSKSPTNGYACRTGVADSVGTAVAVSTAMGAAASGTINASSNVSFQCRMQFPTDEDVIGVRQIDQVLVYTYTS